MGKYLQIIFNNLSGLNLKGPAPHQILARYSFTEVVLCWQANCIKAQAKEKMLLKNSREEVKEGEGGITIESFCKV
jgi:hypothetical protein